ncbi:hypothetical protein DDE82_000018 [Stemphylium lycopersici]|nr:hypothetical protein DDE82_000018 [Stemphylium lycopersici]
MSIILDALAKHGVRGALNTLLCSQSNDGDHSGTVNPRYVCARKKHESGRKGRASVYRVIDTRRAEDGHQASRYANVEGPDLDEDQQLGFTGVTKATDCKRGHSVRRTMVQNHQIEDVGVVSILKPPGDPQTAQPSVFPPPPDSFSQTAATPAATRRSKLEKNIATSKTAEIIGDFEVGEAEGEREGEDEESGISNDPEITEDPFTQPGMTPQESVNLVFGASSLAAV